MGSRMEPNQDPLLDFRSTVDDAWYTVERLVLSKKNNTLTVKLLEFGDEDDEKFNVRDFENAKELDLFIERFRPACVQLQDEDCKDVRRLWYVCALLEQGEDDQRFYNAFIESVHREPHTLKGEQEICSCAFVVGWLEGPKKGETEQMRLENICRIQRGSPLFDDGLANFVKMSRAQLGLVSNGNQVPVEKVKC
ncbi:hypothetical protein MKW94_007805 [Papaver nudicaule]|uniref:SAWADEE domain-containing protein n=1 Tax=Papaver nudicaule TaxID=74823 RepID=A0AA41V8D1_PAPNU|nr:hypothetical protein [Papaver nudicaule]